MASLVRERAARGHGSIWRTARSRVVAHTAYGDLLPMSPVVGRPSSNPGLPQRRPYPDGAATLVGSRFGADHGTNHRRGTLHSVRRRPGGENSVLLPGTGCLPTPQRPRDDPIQPPRRHNTRADAVGRHQAPARRPSPRPTDGGRNTAFRTVPPRRGSHRIPSQSRRGRRERAQPGGTTPLGRCCRILRAPHAAIRLEGELPSVFNRASSIPRERWLINRADPCHVQTTP